LIRCAWHCSSPAAEALAFLLIAALAALVLTLAGWRPSPATAPPPPALLPPVPPLELLRVVELRALAHAAGLPRLARSGRRVELLQALAVAPQPLQLGLIHHHPHIGVEAAKWRGHGFQRMGS